MENFIKQEASSPELISMIQCRNFLIVSRMSEVASGCGSWILLRMYNGGAPESDATNVKLLPLPQPPVRARTDAQTNPSAQRATQLRSVLARLYAVSIQNQITTTVP
jgi:hypothetical protein